MEQNEDTMDKMIQEISEVTKGTSDKHDEHLDEMSKPIVYKNILVLSVASMLQFSAFNSFANLQSSLNKAEGLGTTGLALLYAVMMLTSLFITPITVERISTKWVMIWSMCTYIIYMATGFYPSWYTVTPASVIIGIGAAHFWLAMPAYVIDIAKRYAYITDTAEQDRVTLFFGIVYAFIYSSNIWGNLFSSIVFRHKDTNNTSEDFESFCGPNYCPYRELNMSMIVPPSQKQVYIFTGFCSGITAFAMVLLISFLTNVGSRINTSSAICKQIRRVAVHLMTSRNQQFLIVSSIFGGLASGFVVGDFTSAYTSCPYGIHNVGLVMITFGVSQSLCSAVFGKLNQYTGHIAVYTFGSIIQLSCYITLLLWKPLPTQYVVVFVLAAMSGLAGAANEPVISALHNLYFDNTRDIALSSYRLLSSLGWAISFGYSSWLCSQFKLYILIGVLVLSLLTLIALDIKHKRDLRQKAKEKDKVGESLIALPT
ncbi:protein unc-93 homolog A-like isoform X1 [Mercenaria mercenaria]|uniref:protein unc-93 homolog A-like isoform X1 n=1 Tax=Mercenaria mercenaria TaxID=6596 RepID=UPI00234F5ADF|nr:protein unc-93 homolog A-like isoform X1 [Mercenaria mercenaria]